MLRKLAYIILDNELPFGILGLLICFFYLMVIPKPVTVFWCIPVACSWFSVFLIGDWFNRSLGEGSTFPHRADQLHKLKRLAVAGFFMNLVSDATGAYMTRLWYYPTFDPLWYLLFFAPIGYMMFGIILYIFYRPFKRHWDYLVKPGRMSRFRRTLFSVVIHAELVAGIIGLYISGRYYAYLMHAYRVKWYAIYVRVDIPVNIGLVFLSWVSVFFLLEYVCFVLKRETLTRDLVRGDIIPLLSIFGASILCIIFIELFNAPFQVWVFHNWPYNSIQFLTIPVVAYFVWPLQYLLLLPIIRLFDGKNEENVW